MTEQPKFKMSDRLRKWVEKRPEREYRPGVTAPPCVDCNDKPVITERRRQR